MPDDSTWKIHKHLKYNISMYELNLFLSSLPNMFLLAFSSSQLMAPPSTQPQQPKSWASPTLGHPRSISGCTLPCTWQKLHNSILSLHVSHHYSENSFRVLPAPFQVPCNMLSCHHHYLLIPPYIIFHSFVMLSRLWFPTHSMLFPTSVSLCSVFFLFSFLFLFPIYPFPSFFTWLLLFQDSWNVVSSWKSFLILSPFLAPPSLPTWTQASPFHLPCLVKSPSAHLPNYTAMICVSLTQPFWTLWTFRLKNISCLYMRSSHNIHSYFFHWILPNWTASLD